VAAGHHDHRLEPGWSTSDCRKADAGIIAQGRDRFQCHVAGALDRPFVVLLKQDRADQTDDGVLVGEDADDIGAPLDLAVKALDRIGRVQLGAMLDREGHVGEHVGLGLVQEAASLSSFLRQIRRIWRVCLRRRGQKSRRMGWDWFERLTARFPLPAPRITHPWTPRAA
jgi:hypothetical protein